LDQSGWIGRLVAEIISSNNIPRGHGVHAGPIDAPQSGSVAGHAAFVAACYDKVSAQSPLATG
jgi:hypothetical protein